MSKIVVIGGTGTVGSQTVQELMKRGADVRVMTRSASRIASLPDGVEGVTGSMLEPASLPVVFAGADKLFLITPLDRDAIHTLITTMDDILDLIEDVAHSIFLYDIKAVTPEAHKLAEICVTSAEKVQAAVKLLPKTENAAAIMLLCEEIDRLESDADHIMRAAMAKLFREEPDVLNIIKLKEIYELLETVTDKCEDVANILEGIVVENA